MKHRSRIPSHMQRGTAMLAILLSLHGSNTTAQIEQDSLVPWPVPTIERVQEELEMTLRVLQEERLIRTNTAMREHLTDADAAAPALAWSLNDAGLLLAKEGRLSDAQMLFERGLHSLETNFDLMHPARGTLLQNLGDVLLLRRDPTAAERYRAAAMVFETVAGPTHPRLASVFNGWATALRSLGHVAEAEELYRRAIHIYEQPARPSPTATASQSPPPWGDGDPLDLVAPLHNLALLLLDEQRMPESEALLTQAYKLLRHSDRQTSPQVIAVLRALAKVQRASGNIAKAELCERIADKLELQRMHGFLNNVP